MSLDHEVRHNKERVGAGYDAYNYLRTMLLYIRLVWKEVIHFRASCMNSVEGLLQVNKNCAIKSTLFI